MVFLYSFLWRTTRWSSKPLWQLTGSLKKKLSSALQNGWGRALWLCGFLHWKTNVLGHGTACFAIQGGLCLSDPLPAWWHQFLHWWWSGQAVPWAETVLLVTYPCSWHGQPGLAKSRPQGGGKSSKQTLSIKAEKPTLRSKFWAMPNSQCISHQTCWWSSWCGTELISKLNR